MTDKFKYNRNNKKNGGELMEKFPAGERERVKKIWDASTRAAPVHPDISEHQVEEALAWVHDRMGDSSTAPVNRRGSKNPAGTVHYWKWIAAAAVILLVAGAGFLLIPQTVTAPYGEITTAELPDGSSVGLNSGSRLRYNRLFSLTNRTVRLQGEAFFSVKRGEYPFIVNANHSTIQVTGTRFNVRSWPEDPGNETEVAVSEGNVHFYPREHPGRFVSISQGQLSRWALSLQKPTSPTEVEIDRIIGWRERMLIFNDKSLLVIFGELERRFDVDIRLESKSLSYETLTAYYANPGSAESVLKDICRVTGLRYAETATGYRVYK